MLITYRGVAYANLNMWDRQLLDFSREIGMTRNVSKPGTTVALHMVILNNEHGNCRLLRDTSIDPTNSKPIQPWQHLYLPGQWDKAIDNYSRAIAIDPIICCRLFYNLWSSYYNLNSLKRAINGFSRAIEIDGNYVKAWYNRGVAYGNSGSGARQ